MVIKVPRLPLPGETVLGGMFTMVQGGKGANQAVAAARAGGDVAFLACIGDDDFGRNALKGLIKEGIDVSMVKMHKQKPSGIALINVSECGENSISVAPGSNNELLPEDIFAVEEQIKKSDLILVQLEIPVNTVEAIVKVANRNNIPIILNPAPAQQIEQEILKSIDIITPNETEAAVLTEKYSDKPDVNELHLRLREMGLKTIIITLGSKGAFYSTDGEGKVIEAPKVEAIDSTAAGDVFNGYLAVSIAAGRDLEQAIRVANKAASISVTRLGAQPSIPFIEEVLE